MIRRTLLKVSVSKEPPQRKALLRTNYKVQGKVCKVIIYSGSTDNLVSIEMVEKLKFRRIPHANLYKFSWLNKGQ